MPREKLTVTSQKVTIPVDDGFINAELTVPEQPSAFIVLAYGTGKRAFVDRMRSIAEIFHKEGLGTLLCDLVETEIDESEEEVTHKLRAELATLAAKLTQVVNWLRQSTCAAPRQIGIFGASTGASLALVAAANGNESIGSLVLAGGRPDLAGEALTIVKAPTLFIVGANDTPIIELTREVSDRLKADSRTEIVPGASHLFEEPGKLDTVSRLASRWFSQNLAVPIHVREAQKAQEALLF